MSNQISIILEELRNLVAKNNDEKDNVIVDLFDSLKEALDLLVEQNTLLKGKIEDKAKPVTIVNNLDRVEVILGEVVSNLSLLNTKLLTNNNVVIDKIVTALGNFKQIDNKQEISSIAKAITESSIKPELEKINSTLDNKEESWNFSIDRDNSGNMVRINAKRVK